MKGALVIGIDAGTSVIKAVAFTPDGEQMGVASRPNSYLRPMPGAAEQDMGRTWRDTVETLRDLAVIVPDLAGRTIGIGVTGQGDGTWLIDGEGAPVGDALLWLDSRAAEIAATHTTRPEYRAHYESTGTGVSACQQSAQLAWLDRHQPERLARAATAFHCKDWLYFKLTGARATDPSEAVFTFGDFRSRTYAPGLLDPLGIAGRAGLLPPIVDGVRERAALSATAAAEIGLPAGTPIVLGAIDVMCSALGAGLFDPAGRYGCSILGSTGMHMRLALDAGAVRLNAAGSGFTIAVPGTRTFAQMQSTMAATINIDWLVGLARQACAMAGIDADRKDLLAGVEAHVQAAQPGSALYHPYILEAGERGPFLNAQARAQFSGLSTETSFSGLFRAVYEGLALAGRDCYGAMGPIPQEIRLSGGAARSAALRGILASVLDRPVRAVGREETGAAGAAMIAAVNLGRHAGMAECAEAWVTPTLGAVTQPDPRLTAFYDGLFAVYKVVREGMTGAWERLARLREALA
jgi:erythritol kinase